MRGGLTCRQLAYNLPGRFRRSSRRSFAACFRSSKSYENALAKTHDERSAKTHGKPGNTGRKRNCAFFVLSLYEAHFQKNANRRLTRLSIFYILPFRKAHNALSTMSTTPRQNTAKNATPNTDGRTRFVQFNVRMTPAEAEEARRLASASGMSFSQLVRAALRFFKKNNPF